MRIRAMVASAGLAATGLVGLGAGEASAGCGITMELHNDGAAGSTIDWDDSDVRTQGGFWRRLGFGSTYVAAGETRLVNFTADLGCNHFRQYRLDVDQGGNSWFAYAPTASSYTTDMTPHIHVG